MQFKTKFKLLFPHSLTALRILVSPFLILCGLLRNSNIMIILAIIGLISDYLDDYFADKFYVKTKFSKKLDMAGDKVFELALLIGLIPFYKSAILPMILEVVLIIINIYSFYKTNKFKNIPLGKIKSVVLWVSIFLALANLKINHLNFLVNGLFAVSSNLLFIYIIKRSLLLKQTLDDQSLSELEKNQAHQKIMQEDITRELKNLKQFMDERY